MNRSVQAALEFAPPGHFYSPHPDLDEVEARAGELFGDEQQQAPPGIALNAPGQLALLGELARFHAELPWSDAAQPDWRYYYDNFFFCHGDAIALYSLMRHLRPRRIIEIGSGFSSAVMLDVMDRFADVRCELTCIEPYPERLRSRLRPGDETRLTIIEQNLQAVPASRFDALEPGDFLFVDSSHVSKTGSDVNRVVFELLPRLQPGVLVHFHDIFYPFEYPKDWVLAGRAWNEAYLLRAFLQYNAGFEIILFNHFLHCCHAAEIRAALPLSVRNPGGSIWLRKVAAPSPSSPQQTEAA